MPRRPSTPRFRVEPLEDRVTPAVTAALNGNILTVTLGAALDAATVTGAAVGTDLTVTGTDLTVGGVPVPSFTFTGVNSLTVVDGGGNLNQSLILDDAGAGTAIALPGAITVNGVETVTVAPLNSDLQALSVGINGADTAIVLAADIATTGIAGQFYGGPVTVGAFGVADDVVLTAGAGGVEFAEFVNGFVLDTNDLTVNASGATKFDGQVGTNFRLGSLTTDAGGTTTIAALVSTSGNQSYGDPVTLTAGTISFSSSAGGIAFLDTLRALAAGAAGANVGAAAATRFVGEIGWGGFALTALVVDGPGVAATTELNGNVTTTNGQSYTDPVTVVGPAVTLTAGNTGVTFGSTVTAAVADTTALAVNTAGATTFGGDVGATRLLSLTTDAAGTTAFVSAAPTVAVNTSGAQTFNDAVRVNGPVATFASNANGAIFFGGTLNGTTAGATAVAVSTGGTTTFNGVVGGTTPLLSLTTDAAGTTVLGASVTVSGATVPFGLAFNDPVAVTPATGVLAVIASVTGGNLAFNSTIGGASAVPFTAKASVNLTLGGNVTLSAAGSSFTAQAGSGGTGAIVIPPNTTIRADKQTYRAGDGPAPGGPLTTATVNLLDPTLQFRNAAGTAAPTAFTLRQDTSITDATLPAVAQFGGTFPRSIALVSDDGALTLASTTVAGAQTTDLLLSAAQTVTLGTAVSAPNGTVRLRSGSANVVQTAAGTVTAAALGVQAATGIDLTLAPNAVTTFAAQTTAGNLGYASAVPVTVGSVTADVLAGVFPATKGGQTGSGIVAFTPSGATALDLTVAAPLAGTTVSVTGGAGNDKVTVNYSLASPPGLSPPAPPALPNGLTFTGGDGTDTLVLTDSGSTVAHTYVVNGTVVRDTAVAVNLPGVENLSLTGGDAGDTFTVTPDANYVVTLVGGSPTTGTGDALTVDLTSATAPVLTATKSGSSIQGAAAFGNRQTVMFSGVESLTPSADVRVTATASAAIASGMTGTITVTVTNAGPSAVTGVPLSDAFPAGLTATWTAVASSGSSVATTSGSGDIGTTADLAANGTVTFTIAITAAGAARGTFTNTFSVGTVPTAFELDTTNNSAATTITTGTTDLFAVGAGPGGGPVIVAYNSDGTERFRRFAFDTAYSGGVTAATGDLNGDGFEDVVAGSAVGASRITVFDGKTGGQLATFFAFPDFTGGVNVAVAGGRIVAGAGIGGGPVVAVFTLNGSGVQEVARFLAFDGGFRGGVQLGGSERFLAVGAGPGGGPHVKMFDATTLAQTASFFAFPLGSTDGITVAVGGTSAAPTLIAGSGLGSIPVAVTFNATTQAAVGSFQAFESSFRGGVRVAAGGIVSGKTTTVVAPGGGGSSRVRIVASDNTTVRDFFAFESAFTGGVYVG